MYKLNKNGFALAETLIVSVFVMTIFTVIFANFYPMMGEYERRENYDDIDSIYKTFVIKRMFESSSFIGENEFKSISTATPYKLYDVTNGSACSRFVKYERIQYCNDLMTETKAVKIVLAPYQLSSLKNKISRGEIDLGNKLNDYINTLPYYNNPNNNKKDFKYRIIVMYEKTINEEVVIDENSNEIEKVTSFSTIGVDLDA